MSRDQFDDLVTGHLRATAPREAPGRVLDGALDRIAASPQGGSGWPLGGVGGLLAAAAVIILAVVVGTQLGGLNNETAGVDPSGSPSVTPSATPLPSGTAPPSAASPPSSSPATTGPTESPVARDKLLLRVVSAGGGPTDPASFLPGVTLMADGTLIWQPASTQTEFTGFLTRTLTPDGLMAFREQVFGSGLLDASATHELERLPEAEPPGRGVSIHTFTVGEEGDQIIVSSVQWLGDEEEATYYQPAPERQALDELARQLRDPESLVEADAWTGPARPYEAPAYQLVLTPYRDVPPYGNPDVSGVPIPLDGALDEFGVPSGGDRQPAFRCGVISRAEAGRIVDALVAMGTGVTNMVGLDGPTFASLDWAGGNGAVDLYLLPRMPDGYPACNDQG